MTEEGARTNGESRGDMVQEIFCILGIRFALSAPLADHFGFCSSLERSTKNMRCSHNEGPFLKSIML